MLDLYNHGYFRDRQAPPSEPPASTDYSTFPGSPEDAYARNPEWLPISDLATSSIPILDLDAPANPVIGQSNEGLVGLLAVFDEPLQFASFRVGGDESNIFQVNWGDGTIENINSGEVAEHYYDFNTLDSATEIESLGYRQVVVSVVPVTGNITDLDLCVAPAEETGIFNPIYWLDLRLNLPNLVEGPALRFRVPCALPPGLLMSYVTMPMLENVVIEDVGGMTEGHDLISASYPSISSNLRRFVLKKALALTDLSFAFKDNSLLETLEVRQTPLLADISNLAENCASLKRVVIQQTSNIAEANNAFAACTQLEALELGSLDSCVSTGSLDYFVDACDSLEFLRLGSIGQGLTEFVQLGFMSNLKHLSIVGDCRVTTYNIFHSDVAPSLKYLQVGGAHPNLLTIDFSNNSSLEELNFVGDCPLVEAIYLNSAPRLKKVNISGQIPLVTNLDNSCQNCRSLVEVSIPGTANVASFQATFQDCTALEDGPTLNTSSAFNLANLFYGCTNLKTVPTYAVAEGAVIDRLFYGCSSLEIAPELNYAVASSVVELFAFCSGLQRLPVSFSTLSNSVTSLRGLLQRCWSLKEIPALVAPSVVDISNFATGCTQLERILGLTLGTLSTASEAFMQCPLLREIPPITISLLEDDIVSTQSFVSYCHSLTKVAASYTGSATFAGLEFTDAKLLAPALVEIFTNLPSDCADCTIVVAGNPGVSDLTLADREIATTKGWTILE